METFYRKVGRRYIPAGYNVPDIPDGLYWSQKTEYGRRGTSVNYWAGKNPPQPLDLQKLIATMSNDDKLAKYLMALQDGDSDEYQQAKENQGGFVRQPLGLLNFSASDLAVCILRFAFEEMEKGLPPLSHAIHEDQPRYDTKTGKQI